MTFEEFEARWRETSPGDGLVQMLVVRLGDGAHDTPARIELTVDGAITGDRWRAKPEPEAQVTLMERRVIDLLVDGDRTRWHVPGDNLVVDLELSVEALPPGTRLAIGSALLEITAKPHAGCHKFRARFGDDAIEWVNAKAHRGRRLRGVNAKVIEGGAIAVGDRIAVRSPA